METQGQHLQATQAADGLLQLFPVLLHQRAGAAEQLVDILVMHALDTNKVIPSWEFVPNILQLAAMKLLASTCASLQAKNGLV